MQNIVEELEDLELENNDHQVFVPYNALQEFFSKEKIVSLVKELSLHGRIQVYQEEDIINSVLRNGLRIFAILLSISRPEVILKLIELDQSSHGQLDSLLPLSTEALRKVMPDDKMCMRFDKHQWRFVVPLFRTGQLHRELHDSVRIPFIMGEQELGKGGFGEVHEVILPASCQELVPQTRGEVRVVRKRLKKMVDSQHMFQQEQHILSMLRCLSHPNIIQLMAAYTIRETHNFLFPSATGDLNSLFAQEIRPSGFNDDVDVFHSLYELASAIETVHNYFSETFKLHKIGCHYDLKPNNILYQSGKLILSDFGLSRLSDEQDGSKSLYRDGGGEYMAPECVSIEDQFEKLHVGRSSDIWSFGCILSEMLTYLQEGPHGIARFSEQRIVVFAGYWTCKAFHEGDKPHNGVVQWLIRLKDVSISRAHTRLLDVVLDLLRMVPSERLLAHELTNRLYNIAQHELYAVIAEQFHTVLHNSNIALRIEHERFKLWGEYTCISDSINFPQSLRSGSSVKRFMALQAVRECLCRLRLELERYIQEAKNGNHGIIRLSYHIQRIIDDLWDMQPSAIRAKMTSGLENRLLGTEEIDQLESMQEALLPVEGASTDAQSGDYSRNLNIYRRVGLLAAMKQVATGLETATGSTMNMHVDRSSLKLSLVSFNWHFTGVYQSPNTEARQVLVEQLEYNGLLAGEVDELLERVQDVAAARSVPVTAYDFRVLNCIGFYHDIAKPSLNLIYSFPPRSISHLPIPEMETPKSLWDILAKEIRSRRDRPSLDDVFAIASSLVKMVATMHKANWLHKAVSAFNIIFFPDRFASIAEAMSMPYFVGFNHSRLNRENKFSVLPSQQLEYQHPEYLNRSRGFCQEFEYYSVGLVLLELAFWTPLSKMTESIRGNPGKLKEVLIRTHLPVVKTFMGAAYADAVATCLNGDFGESSSSAEVREIFERKVVHKIQKMQA